jgi:hypothetical protein
MIKWRNMSQYHNNRVAAKGKKYCHNVLLPVLLMVLVSLSLLLSSCATLSGSKHEERHMTMLQALEEEWGIKVLDVRLTAAGRMLNFRYRIVHPERASSLVQPKVKPYIIDEKSGMKSAVPNLPKVGSLRQRSKEAKSDRIYFILFSNPGKFIKSGNKVTVVIGDLSIKNLVVE